MTAGRKKQPRTSDLRVSAVVGKRRGRRNKISDDSGSESDASQEPRRRSRNRSGSDDGSHFSDSDLSGGSSCSDDYSSDGSSRGVGIGSRRKRPRGQQRRSTLGDEVRRAVREGASANSKGVMDFIRARFRSADSDRNGHVDGAEFRQLISAVLGGRAVSVEETAAVMKSIDSDGNGRITYDEFVSFISMDLPAIRSVALALHKGLQAKVEEDGAAKTFTRFASAPAKRRPSSIGVAELRSMAAKVGGDKEAVRKMTAGEMTALLAEIDTEGTGRADKGAFTAFMSNYAADADRAERERGKPVGSKSVALRQLKSQRFVGPKDA